MKSACETPTIATHALNDTSSPSFPSPLPFLPCPPLPCPPLPCPLLPCPLLPFPSLLTETVRVRAGPSSRNQLCLKQRQVHLPCLPPRHSDRCLHPPHLTVAGAWLCWVQVSCAPAVLSSEDKPPKTFELPYDYLVVGVGAVPSTCVRFFPLCAASHQTKAGLILPLHFSPLQVWRSWRSAACVLHERSC